MNDPMSYLDLPPILAFSAPPELLPVLGSTLAPLLDADLTKLNPSMGDMVQILETQFCVITGMSYSSASAGMANILARLVFFSGLVNVADCEKDEFGDCNGAPHLVSISDKGIEFVKAYRAARDSNGNPPKKDSLNDRLNADADEFLQGWDETDMP